MSMRDNINWNEVKRTTLSELAKKAGKSDIADVFEDSNTMSDVFSLIGEPHFQERASVNGSYTMIWFASDGWIHLRGTGKGYGSNTSMNLSNIVPSKLTLEKGNVTSETSKGYDLLKRQENPWGMMQWVNWDNNDDHSYEMWKEKVKN